MALEPSLAAFPVSLVNVGDIAPFEFFEPEPLVKDSSSSLPSVITTITTLLWFVMLVLDIWICTSHLIHFLFISNTDNCDHCQVFFSIKVEVLTTSRNKGILVVR